MTGDPKAPRATGSMVTEFRLEGARCLVTGGASFIGSHLVEALLALGASVRVIDDLSSGRLENLAGAIDGIEFREADLRDRNVTREAVAGAECVFHLAAEHGGRGYIDSHPAACLGNIALDQAVLDAAAREGVGRFVYASSACVYPVDLQQEKTLLHEEMAGFAARGDAFPDGEYGWAKLMGELALHAWRHEFGLAGVACRISTAYGPRENETHAAIALIARAIARQTPFEIWGDGAQTRGFTYVDDVVRGLLRAAERVGNASPVNLGSDDFVSVDELAKCVFRATGWRPEDGIRHLPGKPVGVRHRALDGSRALALLGWQPQVSLEDGIARTVDWYRTRFDAKRAAERLEKGLMERR